MKVNFLADHIGASQLAYYLVEYANHMAESGTGQVIIFYEQLHRPCRRLLAPAMMMFEAWAQQGVSIATSVPTAARLIDFPGPHRKLFYVWDMAWTINPKRYGPLAELFRSPELTLIARCSDHASVLENNFNVEVPYVFDNFDKEAMLKAIQDDRKTQ